MQKSPSTNKFIPLLFQTKSGKTLTIKTLELDHAQQLYAFYKKAAAETTHTLICKDRLLPLEKLQERIQASFDPSELFLVVFDGDKIIASIHFRATHPKHPWAMHVGEFGIGVLQNYWNQGIAKELLRQMEKYALTIGVTRIESKVRCNNPEGIALYERCGYTFEGKREKAAFINDSFIDEFYIAKLLT